MAIIDWPTTRPFAGALFSLGLDVSESANTGFLTGNRTRRSNLVDRLRGILTVPPAKDKDGGAQREAFMLGWRSSGDTLRMGMPHRPALSGSLRGSPVLSASAATGTRSISISGALSGVNLLSSSGFEIDTNSDGLADGWQTYSNGSVTGGAPDGLVTGSASPKAQRMYADLLGATAADQYGLRKSVDTAVMAGLSYVLSADVRGTATAGASVRLLVDWYTSGLVFISSSTATSAMATAWARQSVAAVAPPTAAWARVYVWMEAGTTGTAIALEVDNVQLEAAAAATPYAGLATLAAGDWLSVGGNLLHVAYAGATLNDAGAGTVPLTLPLQKALASSAAVTWSAPTGLWELDDDGLQLDYSAPALQAGFAIPLRQVIA